MSGAFILFWYHKDNKQHPNNREIKSEDALIIYFFRVDIAKQDGVED